MIGLLGFIAHMHVALKGDPGALLLVASIMWERPVLAE